MTVDDLQSHIEDILDVLNEDSEKDVSKEELEKELKKFIEYGVPIEQAKQTLIKKFGGSVILPSSTDRTLISDLQVNDANVNLLCRVISINPKEITVKGETRKIYYGIFGDESGTIPFTAWKDFELEKGNVIEISNAYTKEWQETAQINLGDRSIIKKTDEDKIPIGSQEPKEFRVKDLKSGIGTVEVTVRIIDFKKRDTEVNGVKKQVYSGVIGDETGKAQFTSWHDFGFKKGDVVKISGGYIKSWKGIPQLTFDEKATYKKLNANKISEDKIQTRKIPLYELVEIRGALDIEVEGTIIEVREGSGYIMRCPECKRMLQNEECKDHGKVKGEPDLRIKLVVDDGTGSVNSILGREIAEELLGKTLEECKKIVEKSKSNDELVDMMNSLFFAHRVKLQGNALGDSFGTTIITKNASFVNIDIKEESARLSQELEELQ
jgi:replication factor A1